MHSSPGASSNAHQLILIAEDEAIIRAALADELSAAGFSVLQAGNADEVLSILESGQQVDLVFSDIHMPGALGVVGLLAAIQESFPQLPVILTSGRFPTPPAGVARHHVFIPKPYVLKVVVDLVVRAVGQKDGGMALAGDAGMPRPEGMAEDLAIPVS